MTALNRDQVGDYSLDLSYTLEQIDDMVLNKDFSFLKTVEDIFLYKKYFLNTEKEFTLYKNGNTVKLENTLENGYYRVYFENNFLGLAFVDKNCLLKGYKYY